jgi:hypothetical protein
MDGLGQRFLPRTPGIRESLGCVKSDVTYSGQPPRLSRNDRSCADGAHHLVEAGKGEAPDKRFSRRIEYVLGDLHVIYHLPFVAKEFPLVIAQRLGPNGNRIICRHCMAVSQEGNVNDR